MIALDPGTTHSAILAFNGERVQWAKFMDNEALLYMIRSSDDALLGKSLAVEYVEGFGLPVGKETFATVEFCGRVREAAETRGATIIRVSRRDVKLHLCGTLKGVKDANVRAALLDKYGGKAETKTGGRLAGVTSHLWAALAVADYALTAKK